MLAFGGAKLDIFWSFMIIIPLNLLGGLIIISLALRYPRHTVAEFSQKIVGLTAGKILGLAYALFFILVSVFANRDFAELLVHMPYKHISLPVFLTIMTLMVCLALRKGLTAIARSAELLGPLIVASIIIAFLVSLPHLELWNYCPQWQVQGAGFVKDAFTQIPYIGLICCWLFLTPVIKNQGRIFSTFFVTLSVVILLIIFIVLTILGLLGPIIPQHSNFSYYIAFQAMDLNNYLDRFDSLFLIIWIISDFFILCLFQYGATISLKHVLNLDNHQALLFPTGLLVVILSISLFPTYMDLRQFMRLEHFGLLLYLFEFVIPGFLLALSYRQSSSVRQ